MQKGGKLCKAFYFPNLFSILGSLQQERRCEGVSAIQGLLAFHSEAAKSPQFLLDRLEIQVYRRCPQKGVLK